MSALVEGVTVPEIGHAPLPPRLRHSKFPNSPYCLRLLVFGNMMKKPSSTNDQQLEVRVRHSQDLLKALQSKALSVFIDTEDTECGYLIWLGLKRLQRFKSGISITGMMWESTIEMNEAGSKEYSLRKLMQDVLENDDMVIFPNYGDQIGRVFHASEHLY